MLLRLWIFFRVVGILVFSCIRVFILFIAQLKSVVFRFIRSDGFFLLVSDSISFQVLRLVIKLVIFCSFSGFSIVVICLVFRILVFSILQSRVIIVGLVVSFIYLVWGFEIFVVLGYLSFYLLFFFCRSQWFVCMRFSLGVLQQLFRKMIRCFRVFFSFCSRFFVLGLGTNFRFILIKFWVILFVMS